MAGKSFVFFYVGSNYIYLKKILYFKC